MGSSANTLLIIGFVWPEPSTTAAGSRMMQLIRCFQDQQYDITFASTAAKTEYSKDLAAIGIKAQKIVLNDPSFDSFIQKCDPNMVLFDRFLTEEHFGWRVAEFVPDALRVLDTEDLHSLRQVREQLFKKNTPFTPEKWLQSDVTKREIAAIYRCDLSLIISTFEMELLLKMVKIDEKLLLHLPFQLDKINDNRIASWPGFNKRKDFICIGNGKHAPNIDAVLWLKKEIWPLIHKALPLARLYIYGSYLPEQLQQMHNPANGFYVEGWVESVEDVMQQHRINLAPLHFGAGIKGKLIDAMNNGT
ncbi:MAG: glycosyltransferase family 4 protein, partial [Maribacter sp.]